jgi:hypothetical protein
MRIRFSVVEEFLQELAQDAHLVEEGLSESPSTISPWR